MGQVQLLVPKSTFGHQNFAMAPYNAADALDTDFDGDGNVITSIGS